MPRRCACCGKPFEPRPQVPDQAFCSSPDCQRARKRQWQRAKLQSDPDYRINQRAAQQAWAQRNPGYWRDYRDAQPDYAQRNREQQRSRDQAQNASLAKMDVCDLIELGFRQGRPAGYGLRRVLIDQSGSVKGQLSRGEHKSLQTDRVILQPGPDAEVAIVNQIYRWFVEDALFESEIAERLNAKGIQTDLGRDWTRATVREVLSNEKYIGNNVYNRRSFKLKKVRVVNQPEMWIKKEGAFEGIVPLDLFYTAQGILRARAHRFSNDGLLLQARRTTAGSGTRVVP